MHEKTVQKLN